MPRWPFCAAKSSGKQPLRPSTAIDRVGAAMQQHYCHLKVPALRGQQQRPRAAPVRLLWIRTAMDQLLRDLIATLLRRCAQWEALALGLRLLGIGPRSQQGLHHTQVEALDRHKKRKGAVLCVHLAWVGAFSKERLRRPEVPPP
eukprot:CAMPEP_0180797302 /NCGR_PEP_ID=MMETSP1038_2-20121128/57296_1 /TAXON_ID=632150 /ORGANISM="Azadinium spinosum, Strain 3D9" /LENGTH=143 /DNA_ID=CAMNT_0022836551 /DNA_START=59 /DNA_END=486 /DNA_ORIENTATION=+